MNQGRITEAKETLRRVIRAVLDGPRGSDLESEMMKKAGDSVLEQSRVFNTFLGSSPFPNLVGKYLPRGQTPKPIKNFLMKTPIPTFW